MGGGRIPLRTGRIFAIALVALCAFTAAASAPADAGAKAFGSRVLKMGSKGKDVLILQRGLSALGYTTPADGSFGPTTRKNVKKLERKQRWKVDGKVSRKDARRISKLVAKRKVAKPSTLFYIGGLTKPTATVTGTRSGSVQVNVIDTNTSEAVAHATVSFSAGGQGSFAWNGATYGGWAADSSYQFKLVGANDAGATFAGGQGGKAFLMRAAAFPVAGAHSFGGAGSRFGAPRSGHIHQGQDVSAACGVPLVAVQSGKVMTRAYQASGAGYYIVIRSTVTGIDSVYMHMTKNSWAAEGTTIYTGQVIGKVGTTGSSTGCHLHFERWSAPGWYAGGAAYDPLPELQYWDAYS
jgi:murein DD-endopeptidase MepM/ murein hydrolase activator NlpD